MPPKFQRRMVAREVEQLDNVRIVTRCKCQPLPSGLKLAIPAISSGRERSLRPDSTSNTAPPRPEACQTSATYNRFPFESKRRLACRAYGIMTTCEVDTSCFSIPAMFMMWIRTPRASSLVPSVAYWNANREPSGLMLYLPISSLPMGITSSSAPDFALQNLTTARCSEARSVWLTTAPIREPFWLKNDIRGCIGS